MKRVTALLLSMTMVFGLLCACSDTGSKETLVPSEPAEATQPAEPAAAPTHRPEETHHTEPTHYPEETHHVEPTHHPEETHPAEPTHHVTATPAPTPAPTPTPTPAVGVDLTAFLHSIVDGDEEFGANMEVTGDFLENYYPGLSGIATKQRVIYQPRMGAVVCEIALAEVTSSADVAAVKDIFQARINYQVGDEENPGGAWYPAAVESWQRDSRVVSHGNFVMMIAYGKCDSIVSAFNALF